jgi:3-oxoacyl-[acyl-carrier-protein] synthase III
VTLAAGPLHPAPELRGARIAGVGAARPGTVFTGRALIERFGKSAEWLRTRTGITQLRRLGPEENLVGLAGLAIERALADAGLTDADVDAVVVATCSTPDGQAPLSMRLAQARFPRAIAFDVNAACAGFCYALSTASAMVSTGSARTVVVVGAEQMSALIDEADLGTSILFGDGAGAVIVSPGEAADIGPAAWSSDGALAALLEVPAGDTALRMRGPQVFRWAVDEVHKVAAAAMTKAGVTAADIAVFVPQQANLRIVEAISRRLGLDHAETATDVVVSGNTSAASIPLALARLRTGDRGGQLALFAGFGAGLSIAAQVVRLP